MPVLRRPRRQRVERHRPELVLNLQRGDPFLGVDLGIEIQRDGVATRCDRADERVFALFDQACSGRDETR